MSSNGQCNSLEEQRRRLEPATHIGVDPGKHCGYAIYSTTEKRFFTETTDRFTMYYVLAEEAAYARQFDITISIAVEAYNKFTRYLNAADRYPLEVIGGVEHIAWDHRTVFHLIQPQEKQSAYNSLNGMEFQQKFDTQSRHEKDAVAILFASLYRKEDDGDDSGWSR